MSKTPPQTLIQSWLDEQLSEDAKAWLQGRMQKLSDSEGKRFERVFFMAYSAVSRHIPKDTVQLSEDQQAAAEAAREGWRPHLWRLDQLARAALLLALPDDEALPTRLDKLFQAADMGELEAGYMALPILPQAEKHTARCAEGLRTNISSVFKAVAHNNPYPADHLATEAYNQMVLKALFVGVSLHPIQGLRRRANPELSRMLCDYAHERWSAHRRVSPELWRLVAASPCEAAAADLERALTGSDSVSACGALLALRESQAPSLQGLMSTVQTSFPENSGQELSWPQLAQEWQDSLS